MEDDDVKRYEDIFLFTPGPVNVPARVLASGARPMLHHRTPEAAALIASMLEKLQDLLGTHEDVLPVHTTGRGAMEGTILNLFSAGEEIVCVSNGKFGEMYAEMAEMHGLKVHRVCKDWVAPLDLNEVEQALKAHQGIKAVTICHNETTTACVNDIAAAAKLAKQYGALILVDAVSSAGCMPIEFDNWHLDVLVTASQKGLMTPPGLSFVVLSPGAWQAVDSSRSAKFYIQFRDIQKNLHGKRPETPGTTPMALVAGVNEALEMIMEEGRNNCYARHEKCAAALRAGIEAMGLSLFPTADVCRSSALTAFQLEPSLTLALRSELRNGYGIAIAEGLGKQFKDSVLRIGHMGQVFPKDILMLVAAMETCLHKLGRLGKIGPGVAACAKVISE